VKSETPTTAQPSTQEARLGQSRQFAIECARLLASTRCHNVVVLDVSGLSPVTDFFVLGTGTSARQMKTVMEDVEELAEQRKVGCLGRSGYEGETWLLCDMVDVIVHVFSQDARMFYDLDSLWGDARRVEWKEEGQGTPAAAERA
jgi:ribosome-associated protein